VRHLRLRDGGGGGSVRPDIPHRFIDDAGFEVLGKGQRDAGKFGRFGRSGRGRSLGGRDGGPSHADWQHEIEDRILGMHAEIQA